MNNIVIRVDAGSTIGLGHIYRMYALSEILSIEYKPIFVIKNHDKKIHDLISSWGFKCLHLDNINEDVESFLSIMDNIKNISLVILDGYHFDVNYQLKLKEKNYKVLCVDGVNNGVFACDAILNYSLSAKIEKYNVINDKCKFLLGPDYLLVRKEFRAQNTCIFPQDITIIIGGSDSFNYTLKFLKLLDDRFLDRNINVVVGIKYLAIASLKRFVAESDFKINVYSDLSAKELFSVFQSSQVIISPASVSAYEAMRIGIPVLTGYYVDNQTKNASFIESFKLGENIGDFEKVNASEFNGYLELLMNNRDEYILNQNKIFENNTSSTILKEINNVIN